MNRLITLTGIAAAFAGGLVGCAAEVSSPDNVAPPAIASLSEQELVVGDKLEFLGQDFVSPQAGWVDVTFRGEFYPDSGAAPEPVQVTIPLQASPKGTLVWNQFGGYRVPFGPGDEVGEFDGYVFATNRYFTGNAVTQPEETWQKARIRVLPSLIVLDFRAVGDSWVADCTEPARNVIQWIPYAMRVRAIGFDPTRYDFLVSGGLWQNVISDDGRWIRGEAKLNQTQFSHVTTNQEHAVVMQFSPVPEGMNGFRMEIEVAAKDTSGRTHELSYPFMVRRPVETFFTTEFEVAQRYEPEAVSGCLDGSETSTRVQYRESQSEIRTRTSERRFQRGWNQSFGTQFTETRGVEKSRLYSRTASQQVQVTDARTAGYNLGTSEMFSLNQQRERAYGLDYSDTNSDVIGWNVKGERSSQYSGELGAEYGDQLGEEISGEPQILGNKLGGIDYATQSHLNTQARSGWLNGANYGSSVNGQNSYARTMGENWRDSASISQQEAYGRQQGWHWDFTQSYSETAGFSQTDTWQATSSFNTALSQSETIGSDLAISDAEWQTVTSEKRTEVAQEVLLPAHWKGMWFRQATRYVRVGQVVAYDLCGNGVNAGTTQITDWKWAVSLGQNRDGDCNAVEPPNMKAECLLEPCE